MSIMQKNKIIFILCAALFLSAIPAEAKLSHEEAKAVWEKVAKATELTGLPFSIKEEKAPNAWVANGNSVTVTTGLLDILDSQSELYGVFAHEAGHAKLGHYQSTVNRTTGLSVAAAVLGHLFGSGIASTAANVGANLAAAGWSREQEVAADDYSVHLAHDNHEDPVGLYKALQIMSEKAGKTEPSGFNSHPPDERRLLHIRNEILSIEPNAKFPDGSEKAIQRQPQPTQSTQPTSPSQTVSSGDVKRKEGKYDLDARLEQMKREEAARKAEEAKKAEAAKKTTTPTKKRGTK